MIRLVPLGRSPIRCCLGVVLASLAFAAAGQNLPERTPQSSPEVIARAIADLGDPQYEIRQRATRLLYGAGPAAQAALRDASAHPDPEIATRAADLLADLTLGIHPDTPQEIAQHARAYRRAKDLAGKRVAVEALAPRGAAAYGALARLAGFEDDAEIREELFSGLVNDVAESAAELTIEANHDAVRDLLEIAVSDADPDTARMLAAHALSRGKVDEAIHHYQARAARGHREAFVVLTVLHHAVGDVAASLAAARKIEDNPGWAESLLLELGEWKELAALIRARLDDDGDADPHRHGLLAAVLRRAGDSDGAEKALQAVLKSVADEEDNGPLAAQILLLNERPEQAIKLHIDSQDPSTAFILLWMRQEYDRALKLAENAIEDEGEDATSMAALHARALHELGRAQESARQFDALAKRAVKEADYSILMMLVEAEMTCGLRERAFSHLSAYLAGGDSAAAESVLEIVFPGRSEDASLWWGMITQAEAPPKALRVLRRLMENQLPPAELAPLTERCVNLARRNPAAVREAQLSLIARALLAAKLSEPALKILRLNADVTESAQPCIELANHYARSGQWPLAFEQYSQAVANEPTHAAARYLLGHALIELNREKEGREHILQASILPLADEDARRALIKALGEAELHDAAAEQSQLLRRISWSSSGEAATDAWRGGDFGQAGALFDRWLLSTLQNAGADVSEGAALFLPQLVHRLRARALVQSGKLDEALREADAALALMPDDTETAVALVPVLRKLGHHREADALFTRVASVHEQLLKQYPDSPLINNAMAWLLARTRADLPRALRHAQKAADLSPSSTAILDTLAEVQFQLGQKDQAIATLRRCIELEPTQQRHKLALKRVGSAFPDSDPPVEDLF